ncbi:hypothetical protein GJAV_G00094070 [Gymnothorax javanicus]|nr:hypothetical protein GJAV_G00094070 [Gymnothorax javanicus]
MLALLVSTVLISVSRAKNLYVTEGESIHLYVQEYEKLQHPFRIYWTVSSTNIVSYHNGTLEISENYENRIEFDEEDFSLLLKSVQQTDSRTYSAGISHVGSSCGTLTNVASYKLIVEESLPIPQVKLALLHSDGRVCRVSVYCTAKDTFTSVTCQQAHCKRISSVSRYRLDLIVTAANGAIHCSSTNGVATKTRSESTMDICLVPPAVPSSGLSLCMLKAVLLSVGLVAMVSAVIAVNVRGRCCRKK